MIHQETPDGLQMHHGDVREVLRDLPERSAHCVVTSPPYFGLRAYSGADVQVWETNDPYGRNEVAHEHEWRTDAFCSRCRAWRGSYGQEPDVDLYCWHTVLIMREVARVLRDDGVVFWNVGDSFSGNGGGGGQGVSGVFSGEHRYNNNKSRAPSGGLPQKQLLLVPFRVAIALQSDGWYVRQDVIWEKWNPMPESVDDRPTSAHEHILLLAKRPDYFYDAFAVRVPGSATQTAHNRKYARAYGSSAKALADDADQWQNNGGIHARPGIGGHNLGSVWTIPSEPQSDAMCATCGTYYRGASWSRLHRKEVDGASVRVCAHCKQSDWVAHFAPFPSEIPRRAILAGTSAHGVCGSCGSPWLRALFRWKHPTRDVEAERRSHATQTGRDDGHVSGPSGQLDEVREIGWEPTCECYKLPPKPIAPDPIEAIENPRLIATWFEALNDWYRLAVAQPTVPATVLDPFLGSGTTLVVARQLGRRGVGIDLSDQYLSLAGHRLEEQTLSLFNMPG